MNGINFDAVSTFTKDVFFTFLKGEWTKLEYGEIAEALSDEGIIETYKVGDETFFKGSIAYVDRLMDMSARMSITNTDKNMYKTLKDVLKVKRERITDLMLTFAIVMTITEMLWERDSEYKKDINLVINMSQLILVHQKDVIERFTSEQRDKWKGYIR